MCLGNHVHMKCFTENDYVTDAIGQCCCSRMLKVSWKDEVTNEGVLEKMTEESLHLTNSTVKQKLTCAGRVSRDSSGSNVLPLLGGNLKGEKQRQGLEGHEFMRCGNRDKTSIVKLKDWQRIARHGERKRQRETLAWATRQTSQQSTTVAAAFCRCTFWRGGRCRRRHRRLDVLILTAADAVLRSL